MLLFYFIIFCSCYDICIIITDINNIHVNNININIIGCQVIDRVVPTDNPYRLYTCSSGEGLIKLWDFYEIISKAQDTNTRRRISSAMRRREKEGILKKLKPATRAKRRKSVRFAIEEANEEVEDDEGREGDISEEEEEEEELTEEEKVYNEQQSCLLYATTGVITADGRFVVVGSDRALPVVWATDSGRVVGHMSAVSSGTDVATAWVSLACDDSFVVGLTMGPRTRNDYPYIYRYQVHTIS